MGYPAPNFMAVSISYKKLSAFILRCSVPWQIPAWMRRPAPTSAPPPACMAPTIRTHTRAHQPHTSQGMTTHQQPVHNEARGILALHHSLSNALSKCDQKVEGLVTCMVRPHNFHQLHHGHGVEEMQTAKTVCTVSSGSHVPDWQRAIRYANKLEKYWSTKK